MSSQLLATKLYIPQARTQTVLRLPLLERLNNSLRSKLILVAAPAGFGKTTLVSEWIATRDESVAWLSLDAEDSDVARFLAYLIAALRFVAAGIGEDIEDRLQSSRPPTTESLMVPLLNELSTISEDFFLVLDDYHVLDSQPIDQVITFLVEHMPPQMHLVIVTREDPQLPLARMRVRGETN